MRWKGFVTLAVALCLVLEPAAAYAQKGGGSRGGSSSGWGGSSRPASGGSSGWGGSRGSSTPAPKSSSGWGGSSTPKPSTGGGSSTPAPKSSSGWGGSSGSSTPAPKSSSGWGGSSTPKVTTTSTPIPNKTPVSVSKKPAAPTFDKVAVTDAKKAESRVNYQKANEPAPSYKTPKGETKPIPKNPETEYLRGRLDESRWVNRTQRETTFYSNYHGPAYPVVMYSDPFHPMMNYWLLSQTMNNMAMFIVCHEAMFREDPARLRDLYARNAKLEAEVAALKARGTKPDPTWYPPGTDPDLLYNPDFVDGVYNPRPKEVEEYTYNDSDGPTWGGFWHGVWVLIKWLFYIALAILLVAVVWKVFSYFLFERRYG